MARSDLSIGFGAGDEALVASGVLENATADFFFMAAVFTLCVAAFDATLVEGLWALAASFSFVLDVAALATTRALAWLVTAAFVAAGAILGVSENEDREGTDPDHVFAES
jgi:hypothetical protein